MQQSSNPKILLVDDDNASRLLVTVLLEDANVTIIECDNSKEAIDLFKQYFETIALVVLDILVRGCEGGKLLARLQLIKSGIGVIAVSAMTAPELAKECKLWGYSGYLPKPFDIDEFYALVIGTMGQCDNDQ